MSRACARFVHAAALAAGGTGVVYGWMRYLLEPVDEFALVNHPAEPLWKDLHILTAPLLLFACALLWRAHVWARWRGGYPHRRRTGIGLALLLPPVVVSGYVLQTRFGEPWRTGWIWVHGLTSSLWLVLYAAHQLQRPGPRGPRT